MEALIESLFLAKTMPKEAKGNPIATSARDTTMAHITTPLERALGVMRWGHMIAEEEDPNAMTLGTLLLEDVYVHVLFDPGAINSFVTPEVASKLSYIPIELN